MLWRKIYSYVLSNAEFSPCPGDCSIYSAAGCSTNILYACVVCLFEMHSRNKSSSPKDPPQKNGGFEYLSNNSDHEHHPPSKVTPGSSRWVPNLNHPTKRSELREQGASEKKIHAILHKSSYHFISCHIISQKFYTDVHCPCLSPHFSACKKLPHPKTKRSNKPTSLRPPGRHLSWRMGCQWM